MRKRFLRIAGAKLSPYDLWLGLSLEPLCMSVSHVDRSCFPPAAVSVSISNPSRQPWIIEDFSHNYASYTIALNFYMPTFNKFLQGHSAIIPEHAALKTELLNSKKDKHHRNQPSHQISLKVFQDKWPFLINRYKPWRPRPKISSTCETKRSQNVTRRWTPTRMTTLNGYPNGGRRTTFPYTKILVLRWQHTRSRLIRF